MNIKRFLLAALWMIVVVDPCRGATADTYLNTGVVTNAPVIDATNFVNRGTFSFATGSLYDFSSVRNYTNHNVMRNGFLDQTFGGIIFNGTVLFGISGFLFDTAPASTGSRFMAANFFNAPLSGNVASNASIYADFQLMVSATNIVNRGRLAVSEFGLISLQGHNVDVGRGLLEVASPSSTVGIFDRYWFFGTNTLNPPLNFRLNFPNTPIYQVISFPGYFTNSRVMNLFSAGTGTNSTLNSAEFIFESGTNRTVQIVFVRNPNPNIQTQIRSLGGSANGIGQAAVEWSAVDVSDTGEVTTNALYLTDSYGSNPTNVYITNFTQAPYQTLQPLNFSLTRAVPFAFLFGDPGVPFTDKPAAFWGSPTIVSNALYSAWGPLISSTATPTQTPLSVRNSFGRIELTASNRLDLNLTRMNAFSYLKLAATNHFTGASNASISTPFTDVALGSTNGTLNFTSLLKPSIARFSGLIDVYSAVWTNTVAFNGETNPVVFNVLMVDSFLTNSSPVQIFDLALRSTNLLIGDSLNVLDNLSLNTERLTIASNAALNVANIGVQWQDSAPRIRALTNRGAISMPNVVNFAFRNANGTDSPYESFVNSGSIQGVSLSVLATNVFNQGLISAGSGPLTIQAVSNLTLAEGGVLSGPAEDVTLVAGNLFVTNHTIVAGRLFSLSVPGQLLAGTNNWTAFHGISLPVKPTNSDLGHVTFRSQAAAHQSVDHLWSGEDRGVSSLGYTNNAALGVLVLDGANNSQFTFTGAGPSSNALYVDRLELLNNAGLFDAQGNLSSASIAPGMTVYYAQATLNGGSVAEFLNGKNGGRLVWVSSFAGPFSGTNVVYPDGTTNFLNAALVSSCNIDSDNDGIPNCNDPTPVFVPQLAQVVGKVVFTPDPALSLSWKTIGGATNRIYSATNMTTPNWQFLTNIVSPPQVGPPFDIEFVAPMSVGSRFYRVDVQVP